MVLAPDPTATALPTPAPAELDDSDSDTDSGSGSFTFDSDDQSEGVFAADPPSEPARSVEWNTDEASILAHLRSQVPARSDLDFEWKTVLIDDDGPQYVTGPFPVGWTLSEPFLGVDLSPPDTYAFFTGGEIDSGCQGSCEPKDWRALMDDVGLSPFARYEEVELLVRQELQDGTGRLEVVMINDSAFGVVEVTLTRWNNDASEFFECSMNLDEGDDSLWPAFADMCIAMQPDWLTG